jgi:hypothetical protein
MFLESLLVILLILGFLVMAYKGAVHEFQILQKDWAPNIDWSPLLGEQLPIVIRNVPPEWRGTDWAHKATAQKSWPILVRGEGGKMLRGAWGPWLSGHPGEPAIENLDEIAPFVNIPAHAWTDGGFRRWSWLPTGFARTSVGILGPTEDAVQPLRKTVAAATVLQATDGAPLQVWLAHEGAIPATVSLEGKDPWRSTAPWIGEVKFIEMRLRAGNALVLPPHWWYALRPEIDVFGSYATMAEGSWWWSTEFHTPVSALVATVTTTKK